MKYLAVLFITITIYSCEVTKPVNVSEDMNAWIGKKESDLILEFGPPNRITSDGSKGKILIYEKTTVAQITIPSGNYELTKAVPRSRYRQFYINDKGEVYYWRTNLPDGDESNYKPSK